MVDSERKKKVLEVLEEILELPKDERVPYLKREYQDDPDLVAEVEKALEANDLTDDFLEPPGVSPTNISSLPKVGETYGDFKIEEEIGKGGTGVVYKAYQKSLARQVAVKVLFPRSTLAADSERLRVEARAVARLKHPGIVPIYQVVNELGGVWLVMDLIEGQNLSQELDSLKGSDPLPEEHQPFFPPANSRGYIAKVVDLVIKVAEALEHAHKNRLIHQDVKPQNILLDSKGDPVLIDFGLAHDLSNNEEKKKGIVGTLHYLSPELIDNKSKQPIGPTTDIYSLGIMLYELLTLKRPFEGQSTKEILDQIVSQEPQQLTTANKRIPEDLEKICLKAIAKNTHERYLSAQDLAEDLTRFKNFEAVKANPPTPINSIKKLLKRRRREVIWVSLLLIVAIGALITKGYFDFFYSQPKLSVVPMDQNLNPVSNQAGKVYLRPIDPLSGEVGEKALLGELVIKNKRIKPGYYRLVVEFPDGQFSELTRNFQSKGGPYQVKVTYRERVEGQNQEMVSLAGDPNFKPWYPAKSLCPNAQRSVHIKPFLIEPDEVTNREYREFIEAAKHREPIFWKEVNNWDSAWDDLPVVGISYHDARAYAEWKGLRLLTHSEWEFAARGVEGMLYPWGNQRGENMLGNTLGSRQAVSESQEKSFQEYLENVVSGTEHRGDITPQGVRHMLGNVSEWTDTPIVDNPHGDSPKADFMERYIMGSAWFAQNMNWRLTLHEKGETTDEGRTNYRGFRCAKSALP